MNRYDLFTYFCLECSSIICKCSVLHVFDKHNYSKLNNNLSHEANLKNSIENILNKSSSNSADLHGNCFYSHFPSVEKCLSISNMSSENSTDCFNKIKNQSCIIENDVTCSRNTCRQDFSFFNLKKELHITSLNIQHLLPKLDEIKLHLGLSNPSDIIQIL